MSSAVTGQHTDHLAGCTAEGGKAIKLLVVDCVKTSSSVSSDLSPQGRAWVSVAKNGRRAYHCECDGNSTITCTKVVVWSRFCVADHCASVAPNPA